MTDPSQADPYRPIGVGFLLLSVPLWVSVLLSGTPAGMWTNATAAAVMTGLGILVLRRPA